MIISQIMGGLGNQLGEYACGYSLSKYLGQELVLDVSDYICRGYFRPYCLDKLQIGNHRKLAYPPVSFRFMEEECIPKELRDCGLRVIELSKVKTREELLAAAEGAENIYLLGYGGMHYCLPEEREEIRVKYQLKTPSAAVEQFKRRIRREYSVAVHLRRTDFVDLQCQDSAEYFRAAIAYVKIFHPDASFYFFSDDIRYAMEQFGAYENYHYVHLLGGMDADLEEFFCLSACDGRILSTNSTFSAWAGELNQTDRKLDICRSELWTDRNKICLNKAAVEKLCGLYQSEDMERGKADALAAVNKAFDFVSRSCNEQAIEMIDGASFDCYGFSEEDFRKLTAIKQIALAQKGEEGLPAALRSFYEQMQRESEDPAFHADYFRALYQAGRIAESAIHAARANRLGDPEDYQGYFENGVVSFVPEIYKFLKNEPARHFIFILGEGWNYYVTYAKSLAVLLARMGQKVTFFQRTVMTIESNVRDAEMARKLLENKKTIDRTYQYHMDMISIPADIYTSERKRSIFPELIRQCAGGFDMRSVVVTTMPDVFSALKVEGINYVVPDICDPLNCERLCLEGNLADYVVYMAEHADAIFLSGSVYETVNRLFGSKVHQAFSTWDSSKYRFFGEETDFTSNYIHSDEMIRNAARLLMV